VDAYNNRASDRRRKADLDGAIADYGEVIRLRPDTEAGYFNRAVTWQMKGDAEAALSDFAMAIRRGRAQLEWLNEHRSRGVNFAELTSIGEAQANLVHAYLAHARLLVEKGEYEQAIAGFNEAAALRKQDAGQSEGDFERARVRLLQGEFATAAAEFEKFVDNGAYKPGALMYRGFLLLFHTNDPAAAAQDFAGALQEGFKYREFRGMMAAAGYAAGGGPWLSGGVPFVPNIYHLILWQHLARERAGEDDGQELDENLKKAARALGYADMLLIPSKEAITKSREIWPGRVIDMFLGTWTPEAVRAVAEESTDPAVRRRRTCDAEFYAGLFRLKGARAEARALLHRATENCPPGALSGVAAKLALGRFGS
jgi:tetratricopeptide (TPR) repeat protein